MTETGPDLEPHVVRNNPTAMPSGLVTFLFTDIEGSTKLWEAHPRAMKSALARHDAIMREAIGSNGGVVFKTIGDAFCAAFSHAPSALLAAVDAQRGLSNESWSETGPLRARMALHTGETDERDGDYFGPPVNRVARLLATGHGGQILVSDETRVLLQPELPQETDLRDMGEHRLKDLARPQRVYQACVSGLPDEFAPLRGQPSPFRGIVIAAAAVLAIIVLFRLWIRGSDESIAKALSPSGLYQGYKGLIVELSAQNEWWLLAIGLLLLLTAIGLTIARWRASNRTLQLVAEPPNRFERWFVNQRAIAGVAVAAVLVLGAWGYQQYLWRVALPIPDDAIGFAMTREASAATVHDALEEKLYTDGQAKRVVIREIPVKFDSSDIPTAREIGERIGAEAVVIYDVENTDDGKEYVAYVVFTDPTVGSTFGGSTETTDASEASASGGTQIAQAKPELDVPVLRSETLDQLIDAAAGIIDYHNDRIRESITYLEQAMPAEPDAPNTGLVGFYLGNAYRLDGQMPQADQTLERAAAYYEGQQQATGELTPQDTLTLVQTYFWRGFNAWNEENWDDAILWGQKAVDYKEDLVARKDGLERPSDARATYARIYALMTEASRSSGKTDDERFWRQRTTEEVTAIAAEAAPGDPIPFLQSGFALMFAGDCVGAVQSFDKAIALDPNLIDARMDAGIAALWQGRPDLAESYWRALLVADPNDVVALSQLAAQATLQGLGSTYFDPTYFEQSETYRREIVKIDPNNIDSHQEIASLASLRAQALGLDFTALNQGDDLTVAKSQASWPTDYQAMLDLYSTAIDEALLVARELDPDNPDYRADVAEAYVARASVWGYALVGGDVMSTAIATAPDQAATDGTPATPTALNPTVSRAGTELLADVEKIREWTDQILSDPNASRLTLLTAWSARLQALEWEWTWYYYPYYANDTAKATALGDEFGQATRDAVAFAEKEPAGSTDEYAPMRMIYTEAAIAIGMQDASDPAVGEMFDKAQSVSTSESDERAVSDAKVSTICTEERERIAGDELLAKDDLAGAKARYEAALEINPNHVPALIAQAGVLQRLGDTQGAITAAQQATVAAPDDPAGWEILGFAQTVSGDSNGAAAYQQYLSKVGGYGPQRRMDSVRLALERLRQAIDTDPTTRPAVLAVLPLFGAFLDGMASDGAGTYQYPALYAKLGAIALYADHAATAEPWLSRAVELDLHLPDARTDLALAVAAQDKDATVQSQAAAQETLDPFWSEISGFDGETIATKMTERADAYAAKFPERQAIVDQFKQTLADERASGQHELAGVEGATYTSPTYGYGLSWDPAWSVTTASSDGGFDWLGIGQGTSSIDVIGSTQLGELSGCLQLATSVYEQNEAATDFAAALAPGGEPFSQSGPDSAEVAFTFVVDGAQHVVFMQCRVLEPGVSGMLIAVETESDRYEAERAALDATLAQLTGPDGAPLEVRLPDLALTSTPAASPVASPAASPVAALPDQAAA